MTDTQTDRSTLNVVSLVLTYVVMYALYGYVLPPCTATYYIYVGYSPDSPDSPDLQAVVCRHCNAVGFVLTGYVTQLLCDTVLKSYSSEI